jgi:hypothetical protein
LFVEIDDISVQTVDTGADVDLNWIWNQISRWQSLLESYPSCNLGS